MPFKKVKNKSLLFGLGILLFVFLAIFLYWYYTPGFALPELMLSGVSDIPIIEGSPNADPRYKQMKEIADDIFINYWSNIQENLDCELLSTHVEYPSCTIIINAKWLNPIEARIIKGRIYKAIGKHFALKVDNVPLPKNRILLAKFLKSVPKKIRC